jgi:FkbM family methyltransferase
MAVRTPSPSQSSEAFGRSNSGSSRLAARLLRRSPYFRGKARLEEWLLRRSGVERARIFGYEMSLDLSDVIQRDIYAGMYEPFETRWLKSAIGPGMTVVDVGANAGYYTWLAAHLVGSTRRVVAFEPGPYAFECLQRVIQENGVRNVICNQIALSESPGTRTLYIPRPSEGNYNPSLSPYLPDMSAIEIVADRLDDVLDRLQIGRVDLMKVDVEGHELEVFRGAARSIRQNRIASVLCEFNEGYQEEAGSSCTELEQWLTAQGFVVSKKFQSKWGSKVHNRLYVCRP